MKKRGKGEVENRIEIDSKKLFKRFKEFNVNTHNFKSPN